MARWASLSLALFLASCSGVRLATPLALEAVFRFLGHWSPWTVEPPSRLIWWAAAGEDTLESGDSRPSQGKAHWWESADSGVGRFGVGLPKAGSVVKGEEVEELWPG